MATTPNYGWPLPDGRAIQITEITKIADALSAIDGSFKEFSTSINLELSEVEVEAWKKTDLPASVVGKKVLNSENEQAARDAIGLTDYLIHRNFLTNAGEYVTSTSDVNIDELEPGKFGLYASQLVGAPSMAGVSFWWIETQLVYGTTVKRQIATAYKAGEYVEPTMMVRSTNNAGVYGPWRQVALTTDLVSLVSVASTQAFSLAQKAQGRSNIDALGTGDKGRAGGVAPLGTDSKVPPDYLPTLTTKETMYSALLSAVYDDAVDNADSRFPWMDLATGVFKRATWSGLVNRMTTAVKATFYTKAEVNSIVAGNMAGRAYPRRSDGAGITFNWSGQGGQPSWIWGGNDGYNMYVYNPANFNVASVGGWNITAIINQIESRAAAFADDRRNQCVTDTRFAGYVSNVMAKDTTWSAPSGYVFTAAGRNSGDQYTFYARQLQVHIPNQGWRAFGAF